MVGDLPRMSTELLMAHVEHEHDALKVVLVGEADMESTRPIDDFLSRVHDTATQAAVDEVAVDFRELEFMNSSCFKCLITWLRKVQRLDGDQQYRIRFVSDASIHWQRRSLDALRHFAADLVQIDA